MTFASEEYVRICENSSRLPDVFAFLAGIPKLDAREQLDVVLVDQFQRWKQNQAIPVEHYLRRLPAIDEVLAVSLLVEEYGHLEERGIAPPVAEFIERYRGFSTEATTLLCAELDEEAPCGLTPKERRCIGRYEVVCSIGKGAFGEVFLAIDPTLDRNIAIKLLSSERLNIGANPEELLREARVIAKLDHPHIVPVYDFGRTDDGDSFIVSKYIKGKDLRSELRKSISHAESARLTAALSQALHAAHRAGVIHRDVKPGNVLLDGKRQPHLLDFGLALRSRSDQSEGVYAGTPAYMSPEQSREESVDGRTDIFSLGIVFYELLAGRRPFAPSSDAASPHTFEPQPPRQFVDTIPRELERICLKALAYRPSDRYNTAGDLADDLQAWLADSAITGSTQSQRSSSVSVSSETPHGGSPDSNLVGIQREVATDTISTPARSRFTKSRWGVTGVFAALLVILTALNWGQWIDTRSALSRWSDTYLPEFARGYLTDGWNLKPDYQSGYYYHSAPLLADAREQDASVTSVAVKTTAPRFQPLQVAWSPQGDRLAIVTRRGQLRIYHWNGRELELRLIYRSKTPNDWVRCFRWHPFDGSAAIATGRGIVIGKSSALGDYEISLLIGQVYETTSIDCLVDQGRVLYVFGSKTGYRAWDPLSDTIFENFLPAGSHFSTAGLSNQYVFTADLAGPKPTVEFWEATWNSSRIEEEARSGTGIGWDFELRRSEALAAPEWDDSDKNAALRISDDQAYLSLTRTSGISIHRLSNNPTLVSQISLSGQRASDVPCRFSPSSWPGQRNRSTGPTVFWGDDSGIHQRTLVAQKHGADAPQDRRLLDGLNAETLSTKMLGARLEDSVFDLHPTKQLMAVSFAGGLEIWNSSFQTVSRVPGIDSVWDVVPLQLHDKCLLTRRDGSGIVVRTDGEPLGSVIPPVSKELSRFGIVQHNSVVEPELHVLQSTYQSELVPAQRSLANFGITALTTPSRHTFSLVPQQVFEEKFDAPSSPAMAAGGSWGFCTTYEPKGLKNLSQINRHFHAAVADSIDRTAIAQRAQKVVLCDAQGRYEVRRFGLFDEPLQVSGHLNDISQYVSVTVDPNATTLFSGTGGPGEARVAALDLSTGAPLWKRELDGFENGVNLVAISDRILVTSWFGWRWIDARWGEVISDVSPRKEHGIRHGQLRKHHLEQTLFSWHRYNEVEPAAGWSGDLDLLWFAFAVSDNQWLVLSSSGELIGETITDEPVETRFVGTTPLQYLPATWADNVEPTCYRPSDSLTLVRYHSDGRMTCQPFEPLVP